jgi:large subunit ribosomal protein L18e
MKSGPESPQAQRLIVLLEKAGKADAPIWARVAELLKAPRSTRPVVNIDKLNKLSKAGDVVVVPGKVLGSEAPQHKFTVAAATFSQAARIQLASKGCKAVELEALVKENPKGSGVKIIV